MCTALTGAYGIVRGASLFLGHFPNEMTVIQQIKEGVIPKTEWQLFAYLGCILLLFAIGSYIQWRTRPEKKKDSPKRDRKKDNEYFRI